MFATDEIVVAASIRSFQHNYIQPCFFEITSEVLASNYIPSQMKLGSYSRSPPHECWVPNNPIAVIVQPWNFRGKIVELPWKGLNIPWKGPNTAWKGLHLYIQDYFKKKYLKVSNIFQICFFSLIKHSWNTCGNHTLVMKPGSCTFMTHTSFQFYGTCPMKVHFCHPRLFTLQWLHFSAQNKQTRCKKHMRIDGGKAYLFNGCF